jgi:hypothetical protein
LPSEEELQSVKLEHQKAKKAEEKRRRSAENKTDNNGNISDSSSNDDKSTSKGAADTTPTTMKPKNVHLPQPDVETKNKKETVRTATKKPPKPKSPLVSIDDSFTEEEIAALEKAYHPNGKLFNPKEYLLLEKAFNGTLSEKDANDTGETVLKKDIKAATTLFRNLEQEGKMKSPVVNATKLATTTAIASTSTKNSMKKAAAPPASTRARSPSPVVVNNLDELVVAATVASPATASKKPKDSSSSAKRSTKKKDKKRKRDRESDPGDDRYHMKNSQDTMSE